MNSFSKCRRKKKILCQIVTAGKTSIVFFVCKLSTTYLKSNNRTHKDNTGGEGKGFYFFLDNQIKQSF